MQPWITPSPSLPVKPDGDGTMTRDDWKGAADAVMTWAAEVAASALHAA